jgi:hypothetical protein
MTLSDRRLRHLLAAMLVVLGTALVQATAASASIQAVADAERPLNQEWANYSCQDASRVSEIESPAAQGRRAYELEVRDGDNSFGERCEIGMGNPGRSGFPLFQEGDERWISFQVYLPDDYPIDTPDWNLFFQIHQAGDGGCPPISLGVEDGQMKLFKSARNTYVLDTREMWAAPVERNRWMKITLHIKNSTNPDEGFVELFGDLDGTGMKTLLPRTATHTMTLTSAGLAMINHARIGIYRNPRISGTAHIMFDGFTIATDRESAEANADGDGSAGAAADPPLVAGPLATPPPSPSTGANSGRTSTPPRPAPATSTPPVTSTPTLDPPKPAPSTTPRKRRGRRVVLRARHRRSRSAAHSSGLWPRVVPVYGWVRTGGGLPVGRRSVVIQIRSHGRWISLSRGWLRLNGRFYLAPSVEPGRRHRVKLRAHVAGLGYSKPVVAQV